MQRGPTSDHVSKLSYGASSTNICVYCHIIICFLSCPRLEQETFFERTANTKQASGKRRASLATQLLDWGLGPRRIHGIMHENVLTGNMPSDFDLSLQD